MVIKQQKLLWKDKELYVKATKYKTNGHFALVEYMPDNKTGCNGRANSEFGHISVINLYTHEVNFKKVYKNTKGLHFKASRNYNYMEQPLTNYLNDFTSIVHVVQFDILIEHEQEDTLNE